MAPRGTIKGSICIVVTLSDIETIWTKFCQNPKFSLRNSVSLTPGPTVKWMSDNLEKCQSTTFDVLCPNSIVPIVPLEISELVTKAKVQ